MVGKHSKPQNDAPSKLASEPATGESGNTTESGINKLPDDLIRVVGSYVGKKKDGHMQEGIMVNKKLFFNARLSILGQDLLRHVKDGNVKAIVEDKTILWALALIEKYPELIDYRGDVTDSSGYTYKDINALELALKLPERLDLGFSIFKTLNNAPEISPEARKSFYTTLGLSFLEHVAKGNQDAAEAMLKQDPELLTFIGHVTDYSGRIFYCKAYEYAYWAKDTHMQRMLEKYMNGDIAQDMLTRINEIELIDEKKGQPVGLTYTQHGQTMRGPHFDFTPLINALQHYVDEFCAGEFGKKFVQSPAAWEALDKIWIEEVGRAQRDVPAHIAHEYCHPDRSFYDVTRNKALLDADPANLKRCLDFIIRRVTVKNEAWFPLTASNSGLGYDFTLIRGWGKVGAGEENAGIWLNGRAADDLAAVSCLDEVRTQDLKRSRERLSQLSTVQSSQSHSP